MTAVMKQPNGKWRVRDRRLDVDEEFETCTEAQAKANECNQRKLREMAGENI